MAQDIRIEDRVITREGPGFIIAEGACNHLCKMDLAFKMVDEAASAGADAIKFQTYTAEKLAAKNAEAYGNIDTKSQYEYYRRFDRFGRAEYDELFDYARGKNIIAFSTPFDPENAQMLNSVQAPLFKIASCDLLYADLLREVACFQKPIILSTGGSTMDEIETSLEILDKEGAQEIVLLACTLSYPTGVDDANYRQITSLGEAFPDNLVGISDHVEPDEHMITGAVCASLGAKVFEKHYTLDRGMGGGSSFSMTPADLAKYVANIRLAEKLLGNAEVKVYDAEASTRQNARRSLVSNYDLDPGTVLKREMIGVKRPGTGIPPNEIDRIVGSRLKKGVASEQQIQWEDLE